MSAEELGALLRRYHDVGDEDAIDALVRRTRPRLLRVARRIGAPQDAEDSVQSAYLALARKRGEPFDAPVLGWLITAVVRIAYRRKAKERRQHDLARQLSTERRAPSAAAAAISAEERTRIRNDVGRLPAKYRDAIVLHHLEGLTMAEIGRLLDLPEATVRTRVRRGRDLLRGRLYLVWHSAFALPWLLQDAQQLVGGYVMKKKSVVVVALVLLAVGTGVVAVRSFGANSGDQGRASHADEETSGVDPSPADDVADADAPVAAAARVTGIVVDWKGKPIAGARIGSMARDVFAPTKRARTDAAGRFRVALEGESPDHRLWVQADGFAPALVEPARNGDDVHVVLDEMATLSGTVADLDGHPLPGATVTWFAQSNSITIERTAVSDAEGAFTITGLPSPATPIATTLAGFATFLKVEAKGFATLVLQAEIPSSRTGRAMRKDLYLGRGCSLRGRVLDGATGAPLPGATVSLGSMPRSRFRYRFGEATTDADGAFTLEGIPGDAYHQVGGYGSGSDRKLAPLRVSKEGYAVATHDVPVAKDGESIEIDMRCWPSGVVRGRVVDGEGRPLRAAITATSMVQLQRSLWHAGGAVVRVTSDADGQYQFAAPGPGVVKINALVRGRPSRVIDVTVRPGAAFDAPDIVIGPEHASAIVEVVDENGDPVWGATVSLRPNGGWYQTGRDGRVRVFHENGGEVHVEASSPDSAARKSPPFVLGSAKAVIRLVLDATKTIRGEVRLADGSPAPGARVVATARAGGSTTNTDRAGRFELRRLAAGRYDVAALHWDLAGQYVTAKASEVETGTRDVVVTLPPLPERGSLVIKGSVRARDTGKPLQPFTASLSCRALTLQAERTPGGKFRFRGASPGAWWLTVGADGYVPYSKKIEIRSGTTPPTFDVSLVAGNVVHGVATADDGIDLTGATFMLLRDTGGRAGYHQLAAHGRFSIDRIPPGRYRASVLAPIGLAAAGDAVLVVKPGARRVRFDFRVTKGGWVSVTVPEGAHEVQYVDAAGNIVWSTRLGRAKDTAVKLPAGSYTVRVVHDNGASSARTCVVEEGGTAALTFDAR